MMGIDNIKEELIKMGYDPDDFNIKVFEGGYSTTQKKGTEEKHLIRKELEPLNKTLKNNAEDLDVIVATMIDILALTEESLERIEKLENGGGSNG